MEYFKRSRYEICGIINSDIYLKGIGEDFREYICDQARDSLVFGHRVDVESMDNLNGKLYIGHDYFFFDREFAYIYPEEGFCIGQPAWDYWMVFLPLVYKKSVKKLLNTIAYHIKHPQKWATEMDLKLKSIMAGKYLMESKEIRSYDDSGHRRIQSFIETNLQEIVYARNTRQYKVLIVYDDGGIPQERSKTYESIMNQTYGSIYIIKSGREAISLQNTEEDLVYFIREGTIINRFFIELMADGIKDRDYIVCGIKLKDSQGLYVDSVIPIDLESGKLHMEKLKESCIVYKKEMLREIGCTYNGIMNHNMGFLAQGLVEMDYREYVMDQLEATGDERLYIYAAGGHTRKLLAEIDFSNYNLCGIIDKNKELAGSEMNGYKIYHIDDMDKLEIDWILISSISYEREIYIELSESLNNGKLIRIYFK